MLAILLSENSCIV